MVSKVLKLFPLSQDDVPGHRTRRSRRDKRRDGTISTIEAGRPDTRTAYRDRDERGRGRTLLRCEYGFLELYFIDQKLSFIRASDAGPQSDTSASVLFEHYPRKSDADTTLTMKRGVLCCCWPKLLDKWPQIQLSFGLEIIWLIAPGSNGDRKDTNSMSQNGALIECFPSTNE